jgi:acetyl esterase/lipase
MRRRSALAAIAAGALAIGSLAACGGSPVASVAYDVPYSTLADAPVAPADHRIAYGAGATRFGELRLPTSATSAASVPVVVLIHGGCWRAEYDLRHVSQAAAALTREGYATWTIEYARVGDATGGWPGTFVDVALAVDHVRALAVRFAQLDTSRVVLAGHSAGGQLALWAAARRTGERLDGQPVAEAPLRVRGVVSLAGIADLRAYGAAPGTCNSVVTPLLGGTPQQVPDHYAAVSPIERVPLGVPLQIVHGSVDGIVPVAQSRALLEATRAAGGVAELTVVERAGHFDLVAPQSAAWPAVVRAVSALAAPR